MNQCANCGEGEAILFTCSHCDLQFCADHQFPHHACERFSSANGNAVEEAVIPSGESVAVAKPAQKRAPDPMEGPTDGVTGDPPGAVVEESDTEPETTASESTDSAEETESRTVPGPRTEPVARDAARNTRPDREGPSPEPPGRGMPWERADETPVDWIRKQSLPGFLLKVGTLSLVFNLAYFAGLAAVVYGYL